MRGLKVFFLSQILEFPFIYFLICHTIKNTGTPRHCEEGDNGDRSMSKETHQEHGIFQSFTLGIMIEKVN